MMTRRRAGAALVFILLFSLNIVLGQTTHNELLDRKIDATFVDDGLITVLDKLAVIERIPIGFERSMVEQYEKKITIEVQGVSVEDVLNSITKQDPNYKWEICGGVVNFTPVKNRSVFLSQLLGTKVSEFAPQKGVNKFRIRDSIFSLSEVQRLMNLNGIRGRKEYYPYKNSIYTNDNVDLSLSNTDVRGILNNVVLESEHKIWVLELTPDGNTLGISF